MSYHGDYAPASSVVFNFNTASFSDGSPITLGGTPALSVYKNSTTESTAGITLTVDYDSRTGMHHVVIDTSADGTFYAAGNDFDIVITTGTVGGTSVVGRVVGSFSLNNRSALRPATAGRTLAVDSSGGAPVSVGTGTGQINASGGKVPATLASTDVTGNLPSDVQTIKTQTVTCSAGVTVNVNVGTTQPVNFNGTSTSALVKCDAIDIGGTAQTGLDLGGTWTAARAAHLDADISSRLAASSYTAPPTAAQNATAVWTDTTASDFTTLSSPGKILVAQLGGTFTTTSSSVFTSASLANAPTGGGGTDPWATDVSTGYTGNEAGAILFSNLNATVSSRLATSSYTAPDNTDIVAIKAVTDQFLFDGNHYVKANAETVSDKTAYALSSSGLDAISVADPGAPTNWTNLGALIVAMGRYLLTGQVILDRDAGTITGYKDDLTTVNWVMPIVSTASSQTHGPAA